MDRQPIKPKDLFLTLLKRFQDEDVHYVLVGGLVKTKTDYREKDILDKSMLRKLQDEAKR